LKTKKLPLFSEKSGSILFQLSDVPWMLSFLISGLKKY
jgi:hypothetical protein